MKTYINVMANFYSKTFNTKLLKNDKGFLTNLVKTPLVFDKWDDNSKYQIPMINYSVVDEPKAQKINGGIVREDMPVLATSFLILDYDTDVEFDGWIKDNKDKFEFYAHTSFNHQWNKKGERFRVIIPLSKMYTPKEVKLSERYIINSFKGVDISTAQIRRWFAIPAIRAEQKDTYKFYVNEHEDRMDYDDLLRMGKIADIGTEKKDFRVKKTKHSCNTQHFNLSKCSRKTINDWLSTSFTDKSGNNWSSWGLFNCLRISNYYGDTETFNKVWNKAVSENWSEKELNRILESINK